MTTHNSFDEPTLGNNNPTATEQVGSDTFTNTQHSTVKNAGLSGALRNTVMSRLHTGVATEVIEQLSSINKIGAGSKGYVEMAFSPIEDARLAVGAVAMYKIFGNTCYYVVFVIEETVRSGILGPKEVMDGNRAVEIMITSDYLFDTVMQGITAELLTGLVPQGVTLACVAAIVVPRTLDLKKPESVGMVFEHGKATILAAAAVAAGQPTCALTADDISVKAGISLTSTINIKGGCTYLNTMGQPIAGDFTIVLTAAPITKATSGGIPLHSADEPDCLTSVVGYVDFVRAQGQPVAGAATVTGYSPVLVVTQCSTLARSTRATDSLLTFLLGLATIKPLADADSYYWANVFEPFKGEAGGKTSLGVLGLEHNPFPGKAFTPEIIPLVSGTEQTFDPTKLSAIDFAKLYINKTVLVAIDIVKGGPLCSIQELLLNAVPGSAEELLIIKELDSFSNGAFSKIWSRKAGANGYPPIIPVKPVNIYGGKYPVNNGGVADIRAIDYLAMLDYASGDKEIFNHFAAGFLPGNDSDMWMQKKRQILDTVVPAWECTGTVTRVFVSSVFIETLDEMLQSCGLSYRVKGIAPQSGLGFSTDSFNSNYFVPLANNGVYHLDGGIQNNMNGGSAYARTGLASLYGIGGRS